MIDSLFRPKHTHVSVSQELVAGLLHGTIVVHDELGAGTHCPRVSPETGLVPSSAGQKGLQSCFHPRWMLLTLLSAGCVLGLTHIPDQDIPRILQMHALDKVEHIVAYALIAGFFLLSLKRPVRPALLLVGLTTLAVVGALDEATQPLVNRAASIWNYVSNLTGVAIACAVVLVGRLFRSHTALA